MIYRFSILFLMTILLGCLQESKKLKIQIYFFNQENKSIKGINAVSFIDSTEEILFYFNENPHYIKEIITLKNNKPNGWAYSLNINGDTILKYRATYFEKDLYRTSEFISYPNSTMNDSLFGFWTNLPHDNFIEYQKSDSFLFCPFGNFKYVTINYNLYQDPQDSAFYSTKIQGRANECFYVHLNKLFNNSNHDTIYFRCFIEYYEFFDDKIDRIYNVNSVFDSTTNKFRESKEIPIAKVFIRKD